MSNLGFHKAMAAAGIDVVTTAVGDRSVLEALDAGDYAIGGEQSGHIIYRHLATTGDGLLAGIAPGRMSVHSSGRSLAELAGSVMTSYPQVLVNVTVAERHPQVAVELADEIAAAEAAAGWRGSHPRPSQRHRAADPGDGRGGDAARSPRRPPTAWPTWCRPASASGLPGGPTDRSRRRSVAWTSMCGIIGILSRPSRRRVPEPAEVLAHLDQAVAADELAAAAASVRRCDDLLKGVPGVRALIGRYELVVGVVARLDQLDARIAETESRSSSTRRSIPTSTNESLPS